MKQDLFAQTSCILLSAGSSVRMGESKALLKFDEQTTFIQQITQTYKHAGLQQILIVVNSSLFDAIREREIFLFKDIQLVINNHPEQGRFYSLQTGVQHLKKGNFCFFQNIDNPFTSAECLLSLIKFKNDSDVIIPAFRGKSGHPVLFSPFIAAEIMRTNLLDQRIDQFLTMFKVMKVETSDRNILANINSQDDYLAAGF
jgi:molybdenum cofactor cytidylyltransferase